MSNCIDKLLCDNSNGCIVRITDENGNDIDTRFLTQGDIIYLSVGEREGFIFDHFVFRPEGGTEELDTEEEDEHEDVPVVTTETVDGRYETQALCGGTYIAVFDTIVYEVEVNPNEVTRGTTSGGGYFKFGETTTITATPNVGYHFVGWYVDSLLISDSDVFDFLVKGNVTIIGAFEPNRYSILAKANQPSLGTTTGTGMYDFGEVVSISAIPNQGSSFVGWDNGETNDSFQITVLQSAIYVAEFKKITYSVDISLNCSDCQQGNDTYGFVVGQGVYEHGKTVTIKAYPNEGFSFAKWVFWDGSATVEITNSIYTFTIYSDYQFTAEFCVRTCYLSINVSPYGSGTIQYPNNINGFLFPYGSSVTVTATANGNNVFSNWLDGDENRVKTFLMTRDINETAIFVPRPFYYTITIHFTSDDNSGPGGNAQLVDDNGSSLAVPQKYVVFATLIEGSSVTVIPSPSENYVFGEWDDGHQGHIRTFVLYSNIDKTITFNHIQ